MELTRYEHEVLYQPCVRRTPPPPAWHTSHPWDPFPGSHRGLAPSMGTHGNGYAYDGLLKNSASP